MAKGDFDYVEVSPPEQTEREWWDEDADRVNKMAEQARKSKSLIKVAPKNPPKIKPDGSIETPKGK